MLGCEGYKDEIIVIKGRTYDQHAASPSLSVSMIWVMIGAYGRSQSQQVAHQWLICIKFNVNSWINAEPLLTVCFCPLFVARLHVKIEYHAVGDTWWQPLLSYGKWCTKLKISSFIY